MRAFVWRGLCDADTCAWRLCAFSRGMVLCGATWSCSVYWFERRFGRRSHHPISSLFLFFVRERFNRSSRYASMAVAWRRVAAPPRITLAVWERALLPGGHDDAVSDF